MAIVVVVQSPRGEQLLFAVRDQDLRTEHKLPIIEERQCPMAGELPRRVADLQTKGSLGCVAAELWIPAAVAVHHVEPCYVGAWRNRVLVDAETSGIREIRADVGHALEYVLVVHIACNRNLRLQWCVGYIRYACKGG